VFLHLNLLHLAAMVGALTCVFTALQDVRSNRPTHPGRIAVVPMWAMLPTLILLWFQIANRQPVWVLATPFALGLAAGAVRGITMTLKVDRDWNLVRPKGRRLLLWVSLAIPVAVAVEIAGSLVGPATALGKPLRLAGTELVLLCAGLLIGRGVALAVRILTAPHVQLRRN